VGINYKIKAHHVLKFIKRLKKQVQDDISIVSGTFADGRKYSYLMVEPLLRFLLKCHSYRQILQKKKVSLFYFNNMYENSKLCNR
jgi:hypothetical protein